MASTPPGVVATWIGPHGPATAAIRRPPAVAVAREMGCDIGGRAWVMRRTIGIRLVPDVPLGDVRSASQRVGAPARLKDNRKRGSRSLTLCDIPRASPLRTGAQAIVHEPVQRPTLVLNPPGDGAFVEFATHAMNGGIIDPAELQRRLRERFPHSIVRPRGLSGERTEIWYVYRDGRWIRS